MTDNNGAGWTIDPNVKMRDYRAFMKASQHITESLDTSELYPYLAKFVKAWPYAGDPSVPESYDELTILEFREVAKHVNDAFQIFAG